MRVDPVLRAFASDSPAMAAAQGHVRSAREAWRACHEVAQVLADCEALAQGEAFEQCEVLTALLPGGAGAFTGRWLDAMLAAWCEAPLAQMPFRHSFSGGMATMLLHRTGPVSLSLHLIDAAVAKPAGTIAFTDCERHEVVLAGQGRAIAYRLVDRAPPVAGPLALAPGTLFRGDANCSRTITSLDTPLVLLRVARDPARPAPTRQVEIASGRIVHRASACPVEGRAELAAALLGAMRRSDAAPALAAYACGEAGEGARWQALRNALALDTVAGFEALCRIAHSRHDPIAGDATTLRHKLCTTYPQLANLRQEPCLAR